MDLKKNKTSKFGKTFMINYNESNDVRYFWVVYVNIVTNWGPYNNDLSFLPKKWKLINVKNLSAKWVKTFVHIRNLYQALNHALKL